jgi:hypothetical protein
MINRTRKLPGPSSFSTASQTGVIGAEVVDGYLATERLEGAQSGSGALGIVHQQAFSDLQST